MPFILRSILGIDEREVLVERRQFLCSRPEVRERLENVGRLFLRGYRLALSQREPEELRDQLDLIDLQGRGFAYEGAAMALALLDSLTLRRDRLRRFIEDHSEHIYMAHVGAGWACARLPWRRRRIENFIRGLDPVLRWLVLDGYGFHEGYFHFQAVFNSGHPWCRLSGAAQHVFHQGLGRSLWFVKGAHPAEIARAIDRFAPEFHGDAWSGIGLACAYAGGAEAGELRAIQRLSACHAPELAQGAAFAAKARERAGNQAPHTESACQVLCGMSAAEAASLCDEALRETNILQHCPYQQWRQLIQQKFISFPEMFLRGECYETPRLAASKFD